MSNAHQKSCSLLESGRLCSKTCDLNSNFWFEFDAEDIPSFDQKTVDVSL